MLTPPVDAFFPTLVLSHAELTMYVLRVALWAVFFHAVYHLSGWITPYIFPHYRKLPKGECIEFRMKVAATLNAAISTIMAFRALFLEDNNIWTEIYLGVSPVVLRYGELTFGYLIHDFSSNVYHYRRLQKFTVLVHHFIGFFVMSSLSLYHYGHFVFSSAWLVEVSDGLSHITWMLSKFNMRHSFRYLVVLSLQYVSFIATRFAFNVFAVWYTFRMGFFDIVNMPMLMLTVPWSIFYALNIYWFKHYHKILRLTIRNHWVPGSPSASPSGSPRKSRTTGGKDPDPYTPGFTGAVPSSDNLAGMVPPSPAAAPGATAARQRKGKGKEEKKD